MDKPQTMTDLKSFMDLENETEIPIGARRAVRELLYVELTAYDLVRELLVKGKTEANILAMADGVKKGLAIKNMMDILADHENQKDVSISLFDALAKKVPKKIVMDMHTCELSAAAIRTLTRAYREGRKGKELQLCIQKGMDEEQVAELLRILREEDGYEKAKAVADPELDCCQMAMIDRLYYFGLTPKEAQTLAKSSLNCKKIKELGAAMLSERTRHEDWDCGC
ncbi:MAG: hypothetical protein ACK5MN_02845 [Lachnospiraceae bacterium]